MSAKIFYIYFVKPTCILICSGINKIWSEFKTQPKPQTSAKDRDIRFSRRPATFTHFCLFWQLKWLPNGAKADICKY